MLEPVEDETGAVAVPQSNLKWRLGIFAGLAIVVALTVWAIFTYAPGRNSSVEADNVERAPLGLQQIVREDDNGIVVQARSFSKDGGKLELMLGNGCQHLRSEAVETVQWVSVTGDPRTAISPAFPGNWRLHQVCPTETGGAIFATLLDAGVAISHVEPSGETQWTQLVTVDDPNQDSVKMLIEDQFILLISHDETAGLLQMEAFDESGEKKWRQIIKAGPSVDTLRSAKTSLGDVLIAWREPVIGLRLAILSPLGGVLQQSNLGDRALPMHDLVQDELGETLILYGEDQTVVELISRTNDSAWLRRLDPTALPIGGLSYEARFFAFAAEQDRLKIWGLDQLGAVSEVQNIEFLERIQSGSIRRLNAVEAALTLQLENADPVYLVLDLRRLDGALTFDVSGTARDIALVEDFKGEPDLGIIEAQASKSDPSGVLSDADSIESAEAPALSTRQAESAGGSALTFETEEPIAEPAPGEFNEAVEQTPVPEQVNENSTSRSELAPRDVTPEVARCTFSCVSADGSAIEYVLMQTVDVVEDESMADVSLRLNEAHENLCRLSGGEPVSEYTRECDPG
ncbi:MAG: hypothetical protein AAF996_10720 [Pseudomonadota bacterium]